MKASVKTILKEQGKLILYNDNRYSQVVEVMKYGMKQDKGLKFYLSLDPLNKAQYIADHLILLSEAGHI